MEFNNKIIINIDRIFIKGKLITPEYVPPAYIRIHIS